MQNHQYKCKQFYEILSRHILTNPNVAISVLSRQCLPMPFFFGAILHMRYADGHCKKYFMEIACKPIKQSTQH